MRATNKVKELTGIKPDAIPYGDLVSEAEPVVLKGVAVDWPLVQKGLESATEVTDYLKQFHNGKPVTAFVGPPEIDGRFFYDDSVTRPNFQAMTVQFDAFLDSIIEARGNPQSGYKYIGSTDLDLYLPGLRRENDLPLNHAMFQHRNLLASIWIGNQTVAAAHFDMSHNLACCMVGRRRFTLFPPEQVENLYPGPLEPTPAGQVVSMVDIRDPDFDQYPRFRDALASAQVADLEPGDVVFFPALWWHQVEALDDFSVMINYWWNDVPRHIDDPMDALLHGLLSLRDRPMQEKEAWRDLFDYYVFGPSERPAEHLPEAARGALGPMDDMTSRRLRAQLLRKLNR